MTQSQNQFTQSPVQGQLDLALDPNTVQCAVKSDESTALVPGQAVKIVDIAGGVPVVTAATIDTDDIFGFVNYDLKKGSFAAGARVGVSFFRGNVMWMTAAAAFAPYAKIGVIIASKKVQTAESTDRIIGVALDKAAADGDLVRVVIDLPGTTV